MSRADYILSYKLEGGHAVFLERMPEGPDEEAGLRPGSVAAQRALAEAHGSDDA